MPHVKIVFDLFHVVSGFGKVIDKVRNAEYQKSVERGQGRLQGFKISLLKQTKYSQENTGNISNSSCHSMKQ
ncbi:MAG: transposase [Planctomycetia bacterium]|nr:transposase [Planctomycetia bacterium]